MTEMTKQETGVSFYHVFNKNVPPTNYSMFLVEFQFPKALDKTWVLARRHAGTPNIDLGNAIESRGRKTYIWQPLTETTFNLNGCTGNIKPYQPI